MKIRKQELRRKLHTQRELPYRIKRWCSGYSWSIFPANTRDDSRRSIQCHINTRRMNRFTLGEGQTMEVFWPALNLVSPRPHSGVSTQVEDIELDYTRAIISDRNNTAREEPREKERDSEDFLSVRERSTLKFTRNNSSKLFESLDSLSSSSALSATRNWSLKIMKSNVGLVEIDRRHLMYTRF